MSPPETTFRLFEPEDKNDFLTLLRMELWGEKQFGKREVKGGIFNLDYKIFHHPHLVPTQDILVVEQRGKLIGFAYFFIEHQLQRAIGRIFLSPLFRGQGIGRRLLELLENEIRKRGLIFLHFCLEEQNRQGRDFLIGKGYSLVRTFLKCELDLNQLQDRNLMPSLPSGFSFGRFSSGMEKELAVLQNQAFRGSWGFNPNNFQDIKYYLGLTLCRLEDIIVLKKEKTAIGYLWPHFFPARDSLRARIHMLGILPGWRGQGLSKNLLLEGLRHFQARSINRVELTVDEANIPAVALYQRSGFTVKTKFLWLEKVIARI